ncbi:MAG: cytochrome c peroxidase [Minicystis sp.]
MLASRSGRREALIAAALALAACGRGEAPASDGRPSATASGRAPIEAAREDGGAAARAARRAEPKEGTAAAIEAISRAEAALAAWGECEAGARYGLLRRGLAAAEPFVRGGTRMAAEVLYGSPRPADEGAGATGALDTALAAHDCGAVGKQRFQITTALGLSRHEVADSGLLDAARTAQALSDAAFELGLAVLQARTSASQIDDADRGEALGIADAIEVGAGALWPAPPAEIVRALNDLRAIRDAVGQAPSMDALADRARLVRMTGGIGLALRTAARARGLDVRAPYRGPAGAPDGAVSALSLPPPRRPLDPALVSLGARLFADARLSADGRRACASCHDPARAFTEPRAAPASLDPAAPLRRNTPTLLYDGLHATQRWDGRVVTAEAQALRVVHSRAELGIDDATLVARVGADPVYAAAFAARGPEGVTPAAVAAALGAYVASLAPGSAPIDAYARGDDAALSAESRRGLDVFAGRGRCARCHVPPLWGGSRPTDFAVPVYAVLGVPTGPEARALDDDPGRFDVTHRAPDWGAFKTPTVRDAARTAPYMHHGRFATLEQVVDFYDRGGGRGLGIAVPNQDPDVRPLHLSAEDRRALLVFLREGLLDAR